MPLNAVCPIGPIPRLRVSRRSLPPSPKVSNRAAGRGVGQTGDPKAMNPLATAQPCNRSVARRDRTVAGRVHGLTGRLSRVVPEARDTLGQSPVRPSPQPGARSGHRVRKAQAAQRGGQEGGAQADLLAVREGEDQAQGAGRAP